MANKIYLDSGAIVKPQQLIENFNNKRRKACIFNFSCFNPELKLDDRDGTGEDVTQLTKTLALLNFDVQVWDKREKMTKKWIKQKLEKVIQNLECSDVSCLFLVLMTHGGKNGTLYAYDEELHLNEIWKPFLECDELAKKPKLCFIQACRSNVEFATSNHLAYQLPPETLVMYAPCQETHAENSNRKVSPFIEYLCKELSEDHERKKKQHILIMLTGVNGKLCSKEKTNQYSEVTKKRATFRTNLSKLFYLQG